MRLRVEYRVGPDLKFLSNLDMINVMQRALRRAEIPYALSEGFNPHIRLSLGTVMPVGLWGEREYFDLGIIGSLEPLEFVRRMNRVLPGDMKINTAIEIEQDAPALMKIINAASYAFVIDKPPFDLGKWAEKIMEQDELTVLSRGKKKGILKNLRTGVYKILAYPQEGFAIINIWVSVGEPVNVRYDELYNLLVECGLPRKMIIDVYRSGNYCRQGDKYYSPLEKVK